MTTAPLPPPQRKPAQWPRWDRESEYGRQSYRRSVSIGLAATVIFHLLLIYVVPWPDVAFQTIEPDKPNPPMEVELVEAPPPPERFVETNPNVVEEKPEDTQNFSSKDQVAAQEQPDPTQNSDAPKVDGEMPDSEKIVTGDLFEEPSPPPVPQGLPDAQPMPQQPEPAEQTPPEPQEMTEPVEEPAESDAREAPQEEAPRMPEQEAIEEEGAPSIDKAGEAEEVPETPAEKTVEPAPAPRPQRQIEVQMEEVTPAQQAPQGQPVPKARPRINFKVPPGPLMQNPVSASRMGALAIDSNFSEFGGYLQRMREAISAQWNLLGRQYNYANSDIGTKVVVEYELNRDGRVVDLKVLYTSASRPATLIVQDAILSRAPYGPWTKEMVASLGDSQTIRITFLYR
ncbi:hypothetical protein [Ruficoccus sp. ZRK36]|uniref:hypothetical protein n=1 Tax=Ruficoccus sp. ZRK36 TaxID=2866311 RepID=UPI001C72A0C6|nr:hypothetical protein [Ruficoccus sp. ZRK36]QYY35539.1 hypothetical protein K0V07_14725 [Ruficoccus sp. ZRK36]